MNKFTKDDSPFLIHLTYTAPHYPLHAKPEDIAKYRGKYKDIGGWLNTVSSGGRGCGIWGSLPIAGS